VRAPGDDGPYLGAAIRGEGRFQLGVMTDSPWDDGYDIEVSEEARSALDRAITAFEALGHGIEAVSPEPEPGYPDAFRTIWQAGAATIPVRRRRRGAARAPDAMARRTRSRRAGTAARRGARVARGLRGARHPPVLLVRRRAHAALATPPPPVGWYDQEDGERNFAQQVQFTPFTSFVNVSGLPAITVPVEDTADGVPMGVQLIGRPGGEAVLFALGAQLERRMRRRNRHPSIW
jgi:amidase